MKRKLDKEGDQKREFEKFLFSSFRQFNQLQIKPICFNCLTKRLTSKTPCVTILGIKQEKKKNKIKEKMKRKLDKERERESLKSFVFFI
jgi:hypothetical protein